MYVCSVSQCNANGFALNLRQKLYKNIQDFYVGNFLLTGMMFCPYSYMEKVFLANLIYFYYDRLSPFQS